MRAQQLFHSFPVKASVTGTATAASRCLSLGCCVPIWKIATDLDVNYRENTWVNHRISSFSVYTYCFIIFVSALLYSLECFLCFSSSYLSWNMNTCEWQMHTGWIWMQVCRTLDSLQRGIYWPWGPVWHFERSSYYISFSFVLPVGKCYPGILTEIQRQGKWHFFVSPSDVSLTGPLDCNRVVIVFLYFLEVFQEPYFYPSVTCFCCFTVWVAYCSSSTCFL